MSCKDTKIKPEGFCCMKNRDVTFICLLKSIQINQFHGQMWLFWFECEVEAFAWTQKLSTHDLKGKCFWLFLLLTLTMCSAWSADVPLETMSTKWLRTKVLIVWQAGTPGLVKSLTGSFHKLLLKRGCGDFIQASLIKLQCTSFTVAMTY